MRGHDEWIYVMLYAVSAELIPDRARELHTRLTDGSIASQRPDGAEIVAAMKRARAAPNGRFGSFSDVSACSVDGPVHPREQTSGRRERIDRSG